MTATHRAWDSGGARGGTRLAGPWGPGELLLSPGQGRAALGRCCPGCRVRSRVWGWHLKPHPSGWKIGRAEGNSWLGHVLGKQPSRGFDDPPGRSAGAFPACRGREGTPTPPGPLSLSPVVVGDTGWPGSDAGAGLVSPGWLWDPLGSTGTQQQEGLRTHGRGYGPCASPGKGTRAGPVLSPPVPAWEGAQRGPGTPSCGHCPCRLPGSPAPSHQFLH